MIDRRWETYFFVSKGSLAMEGILDLDVLPNSLRLQNVFLERCSFIGMFIGENKSSLALIQIYENLKLKFKVTN